MRDRFLYIMFGQPNPNPRLYPARAARGHMPFDHRNQAEVIEHEGRKQVTQKLGR